ncbi:hypothetical protein IU474_25985 [Nocardia otitidiscaviarum]|uniref:TRADD-N-associated membrane domain-containing protein n=1 Tax=Nocardia otitidiscaviarum TaxID=1823 RepID=UPI001895C3A5|nr:hypothetical protein [Nocardia otitidiscaviarum]MBF6240499.1 hypothetical protein [Nocardia otitidiscaviarum]
MTAGIGALLGVSGALVSIAWPQWTLSTISGEPVRVSTMLFFAAASAFFMAYLSWFNSDPFLNLLHRYELELEVEKAQEAVQGPDDLMGLLRANRKQMDAYDELARQHGASSHRATTWAMVVGLLMVAVGLAIAWYAEEPATKYSAAIIAATATAAGSFITQTFIRVQARAQDQMQFYFRQPLDHSYLLTAERLASQLPEPIRSDQYTQIIATALNQAGAGTLPVTITTTSAMSTTDESSPSGDSGELTQQQ